MMGADPICGELSGLFLRKLKARFAALVGRAATDAHIMNCPVRVLVIQKASSGVYATTVSSVPAAGLSHVEA